MTKKAMSRSAQLLGNALLYRKEFGKSVSNILSYF